MKDTVTMHIDKFDGEVVIEPDHPLAIAQREKDGKPKASRAAARSTSPAPETPASTTGTAAAEPAVPASPAPKKRARKRASR